MGAVRIGRTFWKVITLGEISMRKRLWFGLACTVIMTGASLLIGAGSANAAPSSCSLWWTPPDANPNFTGAAGLCTRGTGNYYVGVKCDISFLPDYWKYSPTVSVGRTTSVTCNYGNHAYKAELYRSS